MKFLNEFQKAVNNMITHMITKVVEEHQGSWHIKQLGEKRAMTPPKTSHKVKHYWFASNTRNGQADLSLH